MQDKLKSGLRTILPQGAFNFTRRIYHAINGTQIDTKYDAELAFWANLHATEKGRFVNEHYRKYMLAMAGEQDETWLEGKVIADFGCGPRGSLAWIERAQLCLGIDVLVDRYVDCFPNDLKNHNMVYVKCTEQHIPIPSNSVDILYTMNSLDHVDNLENMADEVLRILKPGGMFVASFNLNEPTSISEPQTLTEEKLASVLLSRLDIETYRVEPKVKGVRDGAFFGETGEVEPGVSVLWTKARKRGAALT